MRISIAASLVTVAFLLFSAVVAVAAPSDKSLAIAGSVEVDPAVLPYVFLHVIDGRTNAVIRSASVDAMSTFSMSGLPATVKEVRAKVQLPTDQYTLDEAASVLSTPIKPDNGKLALKVVTVAAVGKDKATAATTSATPLAGAVTLAMLVGVWYARDLLTNALNFPTIKPPKPRKIMVQR